MKRIVSLILCAVLVLGMLPGLSLTAKAAVPTITWYSVGGGMPSNWNSWTNKVNAYLEAKIGVHLNMQVISWGEWGTRRNELVQSGTGYDIMFAPGGDFVRDTSMGACAPLDGYLVDCPGLTNLIPDAYFDACRVNGVLYGIPAYKDCSMTNYFVWSKDIVEEYFPEYADAHTLAEIYEGLKACVENNAEIGLGLASNGFPPTSGQKYDSAGLPDCGIGIAYEGGVRFVPVWEQADVQTDLEVLSKMYADGLINSDAPVLDTFEGMCIVGVAQGWPSAAKGWGERRGCEVVVSQYEDTVVSTDIVRGSVLTINANSAHKLEAMKLIELVNTDTKLRDMLWYGEEGVNFNYVQENGVTKVSKINIDWTMAAYTQGTFFNVTPEVGSAGYGEIRVLNEQATVSPAMGFTPDISAMADTCAALAAIKQNYASMFVTGADISVIDDMMAEMRAVGFDDVLAEVNRQYAEWLNNRHVHSYRSTVTAATCTERGYTTYTCTGCGNTYNSNYVNALGHNYVGGLCTRCGVNDPNYEAPVTGPDGVTRIAGAGRVETSLGIANALKAQLGVNKFSNVVVASALNFPDALAGSYLAAKMDAPILLTYPGQQADVMAYIHGNLENGGTVYILGGESAVSANFASMLSASGVHCERVEGNDRFGTNLAILNKAGVSAGQPILVCTAMGFADSLSVSATGMPILLVGGSLNAAQKDFLNRCGGGKFWIIGGYGAVSAAVENELKQYASEIERLAGAGRHETSVLVADRLVSDATSAVIAYSMNFPDGLCGGPLAYALGAPLILTTSTDTCVNEFTTPRNISAGFVLGGSGLVNDVAVRRIFHLSAGSPIPTK